MAILLKIGVIIGLLEAMLLNKLYIKWMEKEFIGENTSYYWRLYVSFALIPTGGINSPFSLVCFKSYFYFYWFFKKFLSLVSLYSLSCFAN